ncbi:MAG TPA: BrnT family toxin [Pyrinomonadaceae bacterium]
MRFEWDDEKAAANLRKHWVSFEEAAEVFNDPNLVTDADVGHSHDEARFFAVGYSARRMLFVIFAEGRGDLIRIISARLPTPAERKQYEERGR